MSASNIMIEFLRLVHNGGTKDYHIAVITNQISSHTVMIRRWGKLNNVGQIKTMRFGHQRAAKSYYQKILNDKCTPEHGYELVLRETLVSGEFIDFFKGDKFDRHLRSCWHNMASAIMETDKIHIRFPKEYAFNFETLDNLSTGQKFSLSDIKETERRVVINEKSPEEVRKEVIRNAPSHYGTW